jgi:hypothetical protein
MHVGSAPSRLPYVAVGHPHADWLWDTPPEYYGRLFEGHDLQHCEVYVEIPSHPVFLDGSPWSTCSIGADMSDAMEKAAHMALTTLCSQNLPTTASMPISLYPI